MNYSGPTRRPLEGERFQVIVIGGGINGVAIARECALAGKRTLMIEQNDFASGTTSRSTRIIHGGLRYLEHGEIGLVREALRERRRLMRERAHLVHPLTFLLALNEKSRHNALSVRMGLWLYERMAGGRAEQDAGRSAEFKLQRLLDAGRQWSIFSFEDAQCEFPERLVAEWLVESLQAGAVARNHTQVLAIDVNRGRAMGVLLRDQLTGVEERVSGTWIINATGPWADRLCQRSRITTDGPMIGGVRGSHLVLPRFPGAPDVAIYAEAADGRPMFVVPWNDQVLVGTTEAAEKNDPGRVEASKEEIEYLLRSVQHLFPKARIQAQDIRYTFCGVRPLPYSPKKDLATVSRKHFLHDHQADGAANMISVVGGKLTTAGELARQCARKIGIRVKSPGEMALVPGENVDPLLDQWVLEIAEAGAISETSARAIVEWHGKRSAEIAHMAVNSAAMRATLCPHSEHIVAEAVDAFANECAMTLGDVLLRRVPVAMGGCWSDGCGRTAALRIGAVMGWSDERTAAELEAFEVERAAFLRKPARRNALLEAAAD